MQQLTLDDFDSVNSGIATRPCPLCGRENLRESPLRYSRREWSLKACRNCAFVYLENPPPYEALADQFAWEKTVRREEELRAANEPVIHSLSRKVSHLRRRVLKRNKLQRLVATELVPGRLLDLGCGGGRNIQDLPHRFIPYGIEISVKLAERAHLAAASRGGYVLQSDALSGMKKFEDGFFQNVILTSFLEHECNPAELLRQLHRVIARGGKVIIKVPNYGSVNRRLRGSRWCGFRFPDHVNYFTPATIRALLQECGFEIHRFRFADHHPFSDNMWIIAQTR